MLAALGLMAGSAAPAATLTIQVMDAAGEGFNDPAPFTPIGGNNATTLGQARLNVFTEAAQLWGMLLNSPVNIVIEASFEFGRTAMGLPRFSGRAAAGRFLSGGAR